MKTIATRIKLSIVKFYFFKLEFDLTNVVFQNVHLLNSIFFENISKDAAEGISVFNFLRKIFNSEKFFLKPSVVENLSVE